MRVRGLLATLGAALALAGAAGCGSAANDYRGDVKDVQGKYLDQLQPVVNKLQTDIGANRYAAASTDARRAGAIAGKLATAIAALDPPTSSSPGRPSWSAAYNGFKRALDQLAAALKSRNQAAIQAALKTFNAAQQQESDAVDALNKADYPTRLGSRLVTLDPKVFKAYDVRGIVPDELDADGAYRIARAYVDAFEPRKIAVGHDMRSLLP